MLGGLPGYSSLISGTSAASAKAPALATSVSKSPASRRNQALCGMAVRQFQHEGGPGGVIGGKLEVTALHPHQLARDGEAKAGAARAGRALERHEQALHRLGLQAGAVVGHLDL